MAFGSNNAIRLLTMLSLGGLLFTVGLRLSWRDVLISLRGCHLGRILLLNFILAPILTLALGRLFQVSTDVAIGMLLLAAAPFAPVVPIFTKMAKGDLALAGGLTALFPFFCSLLTPFVSQLGSENSSRQRLPR